MPKVEVLPSGRPTGSIIQQYIENRAKIYGWVDFCIPVDVYEVVRRGFVCSIAPYPLEVRGFSRNGSCPGMIIMFLCHILGAPHQLDADSIYMSPLLQCGYMCC